MTTLFLIIIAVVILAILLSRRGRNELRTRLDTGANAFVGICEAALESSAKKRANLERVMELFGNKSEVSNADVRQVLGVSDATATRYFDELEKEGKVRQVGKTGRHVHYERT